MMTSFKPLFDRILLLPTSEESKTPGGLYIAERNGFGDVLKATVVAVGPGRQLDDGTFADPCVYVGNTVLYHRGQGTNVILEGKNYLLVHGNAIVGTVGA